MANVPGTRKVGGGLVSRFSAWAEGLRYPQLFVLLATVFVVDLALPDFIPFADEVLLGLATIFVARLRGRKGDAE